MARIKFVLNERRLALVAAQEMARANQGAQPLGEDGELFESQPTA